MRSCSQLLFRTFPLQWTYGTCNSLDGEGRLGAMLAWKALAPPVVQFFPSHLSCFYSAHFAFQISKSVASSFESKTRMPGRHRQHQSSSRSSGDRITRTSSIKWYQSRHNTDAAGETALFDRTDGQPGRGHRSGEGDGTLFPPGLIKKEGE